MKHRPRLPSDQPPEASERLPAAGLRGIVDLGRPQANVSLTGNQAHQEFRWLKAEAERRHVSKSHLVRDALRAYRLVCPDAAPVPEAEGTKKSAWTSDANPRLR